MTLITRLNNEVSVEALPAPGSSLCVTAGSAIVKMCHLSGSCVFIFQCRELPSRLDHFSRFCFNEGYEILIDKEHKAEARYLHYRVMT